MQWKSATRTYGVLSSTLLLLVGFATGWLSAMIFGGQFPVGGDVAALLGPGRGANAATPAELRQQFTIFWEVWNLIENEFYHQEPLDRQRMIHGAISGMLASLEDPYTVYQEPDLAAQTNDHMQGNVQGIGAYIRITEGRAYIDRLLKDSPAQQGGLQPEDEIVAIDGQTVAMLIAGLDINEANVKVAAQVRGPSGSTVALSLFRADERRSFDVTLTRAEVAISSIAHQQLDSGIAYVQITDFKATTAADLDRALGELLPQSPRGIILDLRNNPGGYLDQAQQVLGRFYEGVALYEQDNDGTLTSLPTITGPASSRAFETPLVVLVNGNSASASEIVAGALHDKRQATYLIGEKTFGKGSVQNIHTLSNSGSARITIAHWLTPDQHAIHGIGITPEYVVPYAEDATSPVPCVADRRPPANQTSCADTQLAAALRLLVDGQLPPAAPPAAQK